MEINDLITQAGASAVVIILIQTIKPAANLSTEAWRRFGALIAIGLGIGVAEAGNAALAWVMHPIQAGLVGLFAGASASGLYQATTRASEAIAARLRAPAVDDYQPPAGSGG